MLGLCNIIYFYHIIGKRPAIFDEMHNLVAMMVLRLFLVVWIFEGDIFDEMHFSLRYFNISKT